MNNILRFVSNKWQKIFCLKTEINLDFVLCCGQSFRWTQINPGVWCGVFSKKVWLLKQTETEILYQVFGNENPRNDDSAELKNYFQLDIKINELYKTWKEDDAIFSKTVANKFNGIRVLRQDPVENLFSFICSSNNNIERISSMVEKLCIHFGEKITEIEKQAFYGFPSIQVLASEDVEAKLRQLGFGYRAGFISKTARYINSLDEGEKWLYNLRTEPYDVAKEQLQKLTGVGAKVADCVCLMSLDKPSAIPVDTHVLQIACRSYLPNLKDKKSLTKTIYNEIGDHFRNIWGEYAGWAQTVLFAADLRRFQEKNTDSTRKTKKEVLQISETKRKVPKRSKIKRDSNC